MTNSFSSLDLRGSVTVLSLDFLSFLLFHKGQRTQKIRQSTIYYTGLLGRWDKRIVGQEFDVPSTIFFIIFIDLGHSKLFAFIFVFLKKNKQID